MEQAKAACPESFKAGTIGEKYVEELYHSILKKELFSPPSRDMIGATFNDSDLAYCVIKRNKQKNEKMTASEFFSCSELSTSLHDYNNSLYPVE